jgi:tetratricopeptide (TPR) repeat protein
MGFHLAQVLSDRHHYSPFICCVCSSLCSIENVVVTDCSHPFCEGCLRDCIRSGEKPSCPSCSTGLEAHPRRVPSDTQSDEDEGNRNTSDAIINRQSELAAVMTLNGVDVRCRPLQEAQPLAFHVLSQVQVACIDRYCQQHCDWTGRYCDFPRHLRSCHQGHQIQNGAVLVEEEDGPINVDDNNKPSSPRARLQLRGTPVSPLFKHKVLVLQGRRPSMAGMRSISDPSLSTADQLHNLRVVELDEGDQVATDDEEDESILLSPLKPRKATVQRAQETPPTSISPGKKSFADSSRRLIAFDGLQSLNSPGFDKDDEEGEGGNSMELDSTPTRPLRPPVTPEPFRKSLSLSDVKKGLIYSEQTCNTGDGSALPFLNGSIATMPENRKQASGSTPVREAPPRMVQRTISDDGSLARPEDRKFGKLSDHAKKKRKQQQPAPQRNGHSSMSSDLHDSDNLNASFSQNTGTDFNNQSINSLTGWNPNNSATEMPVPMETLEEESELDADYDLQFDPDPKMKHLHDPSSPTVNNTNNSNTSTTVASSTASAAETRKIFEKAEKLKKQANAKFNKGDFAASLTLYTEGISVMSAVKAISVDERELLSNMYSNRAVTFFREKKFENCIEDCDKALVFVPTYDKSWIRKWRALMALGNISAAHTCLEAARKAVPDSQRIREELEKCQGDKNLLEDIDRMCENGEFKKAGDLLKPYSRNTDNIGLLLAAARVDAGLGFTELAMEKVNKALRFVPMHSEGLEIRGHILFLTGETEKGAHLLQESYVRNKDKKSVRIDLIRCQKTHSAVTKGRSCVKRGRYYEAVDHFSTAIKESGDVPAKAPLYGILRTERAEAFLLSKCYQEALKDCNDVLMAQNENAGACSVRAEILISMGKAEEAKTELERIRSTWGSDNPTIDEAYRRVDFELRVLKADNDLMTFVDDLENGRFDFSDVQKPRSPSRRQLGYKSRSRRSLEGDYSSPPGRMRADSNARSVEKDRRVESNGRVSHSKSKPRDRSGEPNTPSRLGSVIEFSPNDDAINGSRSSIKRRPTLEKAGESEKLLLSERRRSGLEKQGKSDRRLFRPGLLKQGESDRRLVRPGLERQGDSERRMTRPSLGKQGDSDRRLARPSLEKQGSRRPHGSKPKMVETPLTT